MYEFCKQIQVGKEKEEGGRVARHLTHVAKNLLPGWLGNAGEVP